MSQTHNLPLRSSLCLPDNHKPIDACHRIGDNLDLKGRDPVPLIVQVPLDFKMNRQHVGDELICSWFFHEPRLRQDVRGDKTHERVTGFYKEHPNRGIDDREGSEAHIRQCGGHSPLAWYRMY